MLCGGCLQTRFVCPSFLLSFCICRFANCFCIVCLPSYYRTFVISRTPARLSLAHGMLKRGWGVIGCHLTDVGWLITSCHHMLCAYRYAVFRVVLCSILSCSVRVRSVLSHSAYYLHRKVSSHSSRLHSTFYFCVLYLPSDAIIALDNRRVSPMQHY